MAKMNRTFFIHMTSDGLDVAVGENGSVRIEHLAGSPGESFSTLLARSADVMAQMGIKHGQEICLGLPSNLVFNALVARGDLPRRGRQTAMLYRLEEVLPLDAEILTADFVHIGADQSFGVAARTADVKKLMDDFSGMERGQNLEIPAACPTAMLAAWQICHERENSGDKKVRRPDWIMLGLDGKVEIFRLQSGKPRAWYTCNDDLAEISCWLGADVMTLPPQDSPGLMIVAGNISPQNIDCLPEKFNLALERLEVAPLELAARAADSALAGQGGGWVNLRRDGLAVARPWARFKGLIQAAAAMALLVPLILAGSFYYRSVRYNDASRQMRAAMAQEYRQVNQGSAVPPQIRSTLENQYKKLLAVTGCGLDSGPMPNSLNTLRSAAAALPADVRMQISEILADPAGLYVTGEVLQHSDVEIIARSLRKAGFTVDSTPSSRQSERGVSFRLKAGPPQKIPAPERTASTQ